MAKENLNVSRDYSSVVVVGLGYVGLPLALLAKEKGYDVVGVDISKEKVEKINKGESPFLEERVQKGLKENPIKATFDFSKVNEADIVVICVPTPVKDNYMPDLRPVEGACKAVGEFLQKGQLVILESTVNPGVCEEIVLPVLEKQSGLKAGTDFYLAHCPERINPGDSKWNVSNIARVVGSLEKNGLEKAMEFYQSIISAPIKPMASLKEAEAVKVVENSFRDINIAFVNELARSFAKLGIDVVNVIDGAATKPFSFLAHYPGCGVGGHCIPVDPYYLIEYAKAHGFSHDFLALARKINNGMPEFTAELVLKGLNENSLALKGSKVAVLGLAYKPNIDDFRESPSFEVIKALKEYGADVVAFDPYVLKLSDVKTIEQALEEAKAAVIATSHHEFKSLTPADFIKYGIKVVVDGRNCLDKKEFLASGLTYKGIGR